ncbi:hypothetical protein Prudu_008462, partial [Prunus dulcis]
RLDLPSFQSLPPPPPCDPISGTGPIRTAARPPTFPDQPSHGHAGFWPESAILAVGRVQTFSLNISLISSPNLSSEASGVQLIHMRDLREVQLARTSSRRRMKETTRAISLAPDPPPKCRISLETLPNFRQKSEEN